MPKPLVIVESPAKARTLSRFLGKDYRIEASYGHIRDLPDSAAEVPKDIKDKSWDRMGVDTDGDFTPHYVVPADKKKHVQALKDAMKDASEVILATDPDREGESISWHLEQLLKPKVPVRRIHFHEITEEAIRGALGHAPEDVNQNLVRAQESRRILDRLYGYTLSPVLWKKVQTGLSAGRVQSVAVRLIVDRERSRMRFVPGAWWDLNATFDAQAGRWAAQLVELNDKRVASGRDFEATTGALKPGADSRISNGLKVALPTKLAACVRSAAAVLRSISYTPSVKELITTIRKYKRPRPSRRRLLLRALNALYTLAVSRR